jgi:hypothetical protein
MFFVVGEAMHLLMSLLESSMLELSSYYLVRPKPLDFYNLLHTLCDLAQCIFIANDIAWCL